MKNLYSVTFAVKPTGEPIDVKAITQLAVTHAYDNEFGECRCGFKSSYPANTWADHFGVELSKMLGAPTAAAGSAPPENPLASYGIVWVDIDGSEHSWPCESHKGLRIHPDRPRCGVPIHSDELGPIYGCSKSKGHSGPHETLEERYASKAARAALQGEPGGEK